MPGTYAICRLPPDSALPDWVNGGALLSVTRTQEELSVVCTADGVPEAVQKDAPWSCFKVRGPIAFSETGVMAALARPLASAGVSIFAVSTFDTDYMLVPASRVAHARQALEAAGCQVL